MQDDNGGAYDPQGGRDHSDGAGGQHEIMPWENTAVGTPYTQSPLPGGGQLPNAPKPPIPVQRRTLSIMMAMIVGLLLVVGGLAFAVLGSPKSTAAAGPLVPSTSPPAVESTDAAPSTSPSTEVSASASDTLATDTSTPDLTGTSTADSPSDTATPESSFSPPFGSQSLGSPVDGSDAIDTGQDKHISNVDYPDSIGFYCPTNRMIDWNVAGFTTFTAVFGIPDDGTYATGIIDTVTFADQNGHQLGVAKAAIGQPTKVQFALKGAARLVMACDRQGSNDSANNYVTLGNPVLASS